MGPRAGHEDMEKRKIIRVIRTKNTPYFLFLIYFNNHPLHVLSSGGSLLHMKHMVFMTHIR